MFIKNKIKNFAALFLGVLGALIIFEVFSPVVFPLPITAASYADLAQLKHIQSLVDNAKISNFDLAEMLLKESSLVFNGKFFLGNDPYHYNEKGHRAVAELLHQIFPTIFIVS